MTVSLCIDLDTPIFPNDWLDRFAWCCRCWRWRPSSVRVDRTARGFHIVADVIVREGKMPDMAIVAAQAILGSDARREAFNLLRAMHVSLGTVPPFWRSRWNVLYERHSRPSSRGSVRRGTRHTKRLEKGGD